MRFEPAGMTDDPDLRIATSLADYIFRRLAVEYLDEDERRDMGILTVSERLQPTLPGVEEAVDAQASQPGLELLPPEDRAPASEARAAGPAAHRRRPYGSRSTSSATSAATSCSGPARATPARAAAPRAAARSHTIRPPARTCTTGDGEITFVRARALRPGPSCSV